MTSNPFEYGNPITNPSRFFGRGLELIRVRDSCYQTCSTSIVGERRAGKSSLLRLFTVPEILQKFGLGEGFVFCLIDLQRFEDIEPVQFWAWVLSELANKLPEGYLQSEVKAVVERKSFDHISLRLLFDKLKSIKIIFLFDEFETILQNPRFTKSFYGHLRYLTQNCPVALITVTRRELVYHCIDDDTKTSPFFNVFDNLVIKPFGESECRKLVQTYLQGSEVSFTESEVTRMIELSGGYAAFFQIACFFLFYAYQNDVIKANETERWAYVEDNFRSQANPHFAYFWERSEEEEKILLALFALLTINGKRSLSEEEIKELYPRYKNDLLVLQNRSLVLRDNGNYRLFSPIFAEWLVIELTDISQKGEASLEEWLAQHKKSFLEKGKEEVLQRAAPKIVEFLSHVLYPGSNPLDRAEIARQMRAVSYLTGQFLLRSGKMSSFYWDKYRFESDPILLHSIVAELEAILPPYFDKLAGLELGGVPLATGLSLRTGKPCLYVRKEPKTYGTCNLVEGGFHAGEKVVVVEDVITTAGQVCTSVSQMRELGLIVEHAVCVIDRQQGGRENLEKIGCSLESVFTLEELERLAQEGVQT